MCGARAWLLLAVAACCAGAGPGPPPAPEEAPPAQLRFTRALYNLSIPENSPPRTYASQAPGDEPLGVWLPAKGARVRFRIRHGDKDKFFKAEERTVGDFCFLLVRTRAGHADVLNRERRDSFRLDVRAAAQLPDGRQLEADAALAVAVADENDLGPLFFPTEYDALVSEDAPLHSSVLRVAAEDADVGLNGEIYYSLEEPGDRFAVHPTTGVVTLTRALSAAEAPSHSFAVLARDRASLLPGAAKAPAARASVRVRVARANLHAPEFHVRRAPGLAENASAALYAVVRVTDADAGDAGRVHALDIVDGDPDGHFRVRAAAPGEFEVVAHALLDRERAPRGYNLTLRASDEGRPPRASYLALPVALLDADDNAPVFSREVYEAGVPETVPPGTPVIRLKVSDRDEGRNARVYMEIVGGNEGGEFYVNPDTGVLYTAVALDAEEKALYALTVSAIDQGDAGARQQSSAKVKITVLDANDNDPVFERDELEVTVAENGPGGAVVARVVARDADAGDNAYVSYSIANLQPVPFDVDHFSGAVRTTRLLDYESMRREYALRIRASDWGAPYRRQAEMRLLVRLEDVNDNRPQFERVDCVGYLPRRLPVGAEILTLSAIDFDAGDVVSYRIIGGNEDNCFALDAGTGVLSVACDLADVRADSRLLNVTATDGTHFADATWLSLRLAGGGEAAAPECRDTGVARRLTELLAAAERANAPLDLSDEFPSAPSRYGQNLHAPEFVDFPVQVKVNESVALGTGLVRLRARDRDLGYNGLLVYGISGGDADSAFRIDPDSGELQVIGYLDRERESEYYLNVTAYDLGEPRRSASRLLPVTVLDVDDNPPRFEKTLASFRVTENALNGTEIFRAAATDRDAGDFARIAYSLSGGDGDFCVARDSGALVVCAPLDRERRALYELVVRATDGGGLHAEALVRVAVDDVNDNPPRFGLPAYAARVREDVPAGTPVAVVEAFDPDLGPAGAVRYSLPDQAPDDAAFGVDPTSGTLRTARALDYEERQVYGVTVRATDGGQPALWAEATLIVEVADVDENLHAPRFADPAVLQGAVREDAAPGSAVLAAGARDDDPPGRDSRLAYYVVAGSGMAHFSVDDAGVIRTLSPLDRESVDHYWLTLCAQDHGLIPKHTCVQVYIEVEDVNDMAPWPERASYAASVSEHCAAGTSVAAVRALDADASPAPANVSYSIVAGNPDGLFSIDERTGEILTTGRTLDREACELHALEVQCSDGQLATAVRVEVRLRDVNDHAPAFARRFYEFRVPSGPSRPSPAKDQADAAMRDDSAEGDLDSEADEDDEGSGAREPWDSCEEAPGGVYVGTVAAWDADEGAAGAVRYSGRARGAARGALRVLADSGRIYAEPRLALAPDRVYDLTVRACDGDARPRCATARVAVRGAGRGTAGGGPPVVAPPAPLTVAEVDAPGMLLAVLQASDPDGDALYYDIVDGDPQREWALGREDGGLVLARRLLWERRPSYALNVSVTDGAHVAHCTVNITVVNDANEAGVQFAREQYEVEAGEDALPGAPLLQLRASVGGAFPPSPAPRLLYGLHAARAPSSARLFRVHEATGVLELAHPLDRESAATHELTVWARDQAPRTSRAYARVTVRVRGSDEHAPSWGRRLAEARVWRGAPAGALVAALRAADRDEGEGAALHYSLAGGDAAHFSVDAALGDVRLKRPLPAGPEAPREYALRVRASAAGPHARSATLPLHVIVVEPDDAPPRFASDEFEFEVYENEPAGTVLGTLEVRSSSAAWFALEGGEGRFRLNPAAGLLATAAPLDYEGKAAYDLAATAVNMGGGEARARIRVLVLDRNEFAPALRRRTHRGRVSEAAAPGALVHDADAPEPAAPLVLLTDDADSPAQRRRAFEVQPPAAAALFRVDPTTGALQLAARLDFERAREHRFTVRVLDAGTPRLPSDSFTTVTVEVTDVNDCPPVFSRPAYSAEVLLPTARGVALLRLAATDADAGAALKFDVIEGDAAGAFALSPSGELSVARPEALAAAHRLRVRASDGLYSATARVDVRVRELPNSGLAFQKADYFGSVAENSTKPTTVAVLNVLGTALNEHVEFRILNPVEGFEVGRTSGAVRSTGVPLDRELRDSYELLLEARSGGGAEGDGGEGEGEEPRVARARLRVAVSDVNDNCPEFVERPYVAAVLGGAAPGTAVLRVRAVDRDAGDNGELRYEMKRGHGELFRVDRRTGQLSLRQAPDAHDQLYSLVIAAFDGGTPACGAEEHVSVRVWRGGAAPAWPAAHVALQVPEDAAPGAPLAPPLRADSPLGRQLIYSLRDDPSGLFEIHFDTGALVPRAPLDYETAAAHELVVRATDGVTGAFADVAVSVRVLDANDCAPEFAQDVYRAEVSEAAAVGALVATVRAADRDSGDNGRVTHSLSGGDGAFAVDAASGEVRVAAALDREARARYHLVVTAQDAGRPGRRGAAHLLVRLADANDCAPRLARPVLAARVSAEAERGVALARVAAWDPDARDALRLRFALAAPSRAFEVDERTGVLRLGDGRAWRALLAAGAAPRSLNVSVSDGAHAAFARVKLLPAPANRSPPRFPHLVHEARALENQPPPLLITTVKAFDDDAGEYGSVTYWIPSAKLRETFAVDASSGALTARVPLDREARAEWLVPVAARDGGGLPAHTAVRVRVADANDNAPEFALQEYCAAVRADRPAALLTVAATDADAGEHARLAYELHGADAAAADLLLVDARSGAVSLARDASALAGRTLRVWVRARDGGGRTADAPLAVALLAPGERAPRALAPPAELFLREDAAPGALLAQLSAAPGSPPLRYRVAPPTRPGDRDLFAVDAAGRLTLAGQLDREAAPDHLIGVVVEGAEGAEGSAASLVQTRLRVLDVNEHAPAFHSQPYVVLLAENAPPGTSLVQLMADDPDAGSNGEVRFSLAEGEDGEEGAGPDEAGEALLAVDPFTGWVTTLGPLDREARPELRAALQAADGGAPRRVARGTLVVRLVDYNDCPPAFAAARYDAQVREDAAPGTVVARLAVRDADAAGAPLAFLVLGGDARARFDVRASGELHVARALDRELEPRYELRVAATDGKFAAETTVAVTVLDVNDNPPYCVRHRYAARLREDAAPGAPVARLETADADEPPAPLRFFLSGDDAHHFAIDKETGEVTVAAPLDRETVARYELRAHAQDRDHPSPDWECSSELLVDLDDVNDNAPRFSADTYSVTLPEDADPGTLVAKVHATDADLGDNRRVRYSFADEVAGFELDPDSGIVTLRAPLDRETQAEHRLRVVARDAGAPPLSASATVRLTVADVNDNPPEFEFRRYRASVAELAAPGAEVARVRASSRDSGVNADVYYSLVAGDDRADFAVDRATGVVTVARPLDFERRGAYALTVQAVDGGSPPLSDLAALEIAVTDANDNAPRFSQASYAARVREDAAPGARVLQLVADDADSGPNGRVAYSIARGDPDGRFAVDPDTGYLSVAAPLDREVQARYELEVRARDGGAPTLTAAASVRVDVADANDNPPRFSRANYSAVVREDRPLGHTVLQFAVTDADAAPNAAPYTFDFQSGNEMGAFRLEQDGYLRTATRFNHRIRDSYALQVRVFDNGTPPLYSDAWVHVRVSEESQFPPVVTPLEVVVNSYLDEFPGGEIGRVHASDRDADDTLAYALSPPADLFEIDARDGTLRAAPRLDVGEYRLNVTVDDGKFVGAAVVRVSVALVTDEALESAVVVRFREVTDRDFVLSHRKGFVRAVAEATEREPADVFLLSVQPSTESDGAENEVDDDDDAASPTESAGERRARRQVARDLDVAFAVRAADGFVPADSLRRRLHAHLERVEERARLVLEELRRASCRACATACVERVALKAAAARVSASDVFALVAPPHRLRASCRPAAAPAAAPVLHFAGDGFLAYRLDAALADDLTLEFRFRTRRERGTLLAVEGRFDYAALELVEGHLQFRMELGSGPALVRAAAPAADGRWHDARLERRGAAVRLTLDRRSAQALAPPPAARLDVPPERVLLGALASADGAALGFQGCLAGLRLGGSPLPLLEGDVAPDGGAQLTRRVRVRSVAECPALPPPAPCGSYPCLNGGSCRDAPSSAEGYACACPARFSGARCELDSEPCASSPCLHGGSCSAAAGGWRCSCAPGLGGSRCELGRWCGPAGGPGPEPCAHGGQCEEGEWGPSCRCRGFYGPRCEYDVDECAGEPCLNGATCVNEPGSFRCLCPPDRTGMNCGNPLYSDAVTLGGAEAGPGRVLRSAWHWALAARWPLAAAALALLLLLALAAAAVALRRGRGRRAPPEPPEPPLKPSKGQKLSNLEAVRRERPASCAADPPPLNNVDTLRSYGSAGDELEGVPLDYRRNLNLDGGDRKPWSEQMHLHTFVDNKIYNDLKGAKAGPRPRRSPPEPHLVGGYHWDCSDWCGGHGALPGISEVAGSERPDSSSAPEPEHEPALSPADALDRAYLRGDASSSDGDGLRARTLRQPDAASLITMLEERDSLLGADDDSSGSDTSARLCEIEDSDPESESESASGGARHTAV